MPQKFNRLIEPFSGMAAISIATAKENRASQYYINDINEPLVLILEEAVNSPNELVAKYAKLWNEQFGFGESHVEHFYHIRNLFNDGEKTSENMLYLLARCVKGSVRYCKSGNFNQSPDKRRNGTTPKNMLDNVFSVSRLLKGRAFFSAFGYDELIKIAQKGDLIYMDPPYQGTTNARNNRYLLGLDYNEFVDSIAYLDEMKIDYIVSYDGMCGDKEYGISLPKHLNCNKFILNAGLSTQATLLG